MKVGATFPIHISYLGNHLKLTGKKVFEDANVERFEVIARNKTLLFQGNRPFLIAHGLRKKRIHWTLEKGQITNMYAQEEMVRCIQEEIKRDEILTTKSNNKSDENK